MPWALLLATALSQGGSPTMKAAREAVSDLRYPEAKTLLAKARQQQGNTKEELVEILFLQGLVSASLGQADAARVAFRTLLSVDPDHKLEKDYPPKVTEPYFEARGWVEKNKALGFEALPAESAGGKVKRIGAKLQGDPLSLAVSVHFHLGKKTKEVDVKNLTATFAVDSPKVEWWAELIGERNAQLGRIGDEKHLVVETAPPAEAAPAAAAAVTEKPPEAVEEAPSGMSSMRKGAIALAAIGVAALITGSVLGIKANADANALTHRMRDPQGAVSGLTQVQAVFMEIQQRREAGAANGMFAVAGLFLATGVTLFLVDLVGSLMSSSSGPSEHRMVEPE